MKLDLAKLHATPSYVRAHVVSRVRDVDKCQAVWSHIGRTFPMPAPQIEPIKSSNFPQRVYRQLMHGIPRCPSPTRAIATLLVHTPDSSAEAHNMLLCLLAVARAKLRWRMQRRSEEENMRSNFRLPSGALWRFQVLLRSVAYHLLEALYTKCAERNVLQVLAVHSGLARKTELRHYRSLNGLLDGEQLFERRLRCGLCYIEQLTPQ
jgi:hypothetical protein